MKILVVLSGGMDSVTMLHKLKAEGHELEAVSFYYKQRHERELDMAYENCEKLGIPHEEINIQFFNDFSKSALTDPNHKVPEGHYAEENMKQTVVPNRNMLLMSIAGAIAMNKKFDAIAVGVHAGDHDIYPDCREEFINTMRHAMEIADWQKVTILAPYQYVTKVEILKDGLMFNVDYKLTQTCYNGDEIACGKCGSCVERLEAFEKNGVKDPITYATE